MHGRGSRSMLLFLYCGTGHLPCCTEFTYDVSNGRMSIHPKIYGIPFIIGNRASNARHRYLPTFELVLPYNFITALKKKILYILMCLYSLIIMLIMHTTVYVPVFLKVHKHFSDTPKRHFFQKTFSVYYFVFLPWIFVTTYLLIYYSCLPWDLLSVIHKFRYAVWPINNFFSIYCVVLKSSSILRAKKRLVSWLYTFSRLR